MHGVLRVNLWSPRLVTQQQASRKGGKAVKKGDLPLKVCAVCGLPFTWRKKWEKCWDEVRQVFFPFFPSVLFALASYTHLLTHASGCFTGIAASGAETKAKGIAGLQRRPDSRQLASNMHFKAHLFLERITEESTTV